MKLGTMKVVRGGLLACALLVGTAQLNAQSHHCGYVPSSKEAMMAGAGGCDVAPQSLCCPPACPTGCSCLGKAYVAGSALYWRVGDCKARYAITGASDFDQDINPGTFSKIDDQYILHEGNWGFRALVGLDKGWVSSQVDYTWFEGNGASSVDRGPGAVSFASIPGVAGNWQRIRATQNTQYQHAGVNFAFPLNFIGGLIFSARYVDISQETKVQAFVPTIANVAYPNSIGRGRAMASFQGAGTGVGFFCEMDLPFPGLTIAADFIGWGLIGSSGKAISQFNIIPMADPAESGQEARLQLRSQSYWVGAFDYRLLLGYACECSCFKIKAHVGWESLLYYNSIFDQPTAGVVPRGDAVGQNAAPNLLRDTAYTALIFGGPTFSLGASF